MFTRLPYRQRVAFKTAAGDIITTAIADISWLSSEYAGKQVSDHDVLNTAIFIVPWNLRNVFQFHYIWTSKTESWLITGVKYRGAVTEFIAKLQAPAVAFTASVASGLISEWAFKDISTLTKDEKSLNNLTNVNAVAWDSDKPSQVPFQIGSSLFSSASSQQLRITHASQLQLDITGAITIAFRVKFTTVGAVMGLVSKAAADPKSYYVYLGGTNKIEFEVSADGTLATRAVAVGATTLVAGQWYSVVGVQDGTNVIVYLNGVEDTGTSNPSSHSGGQFNNAQNFCLGCRSDSTQFLNGRLAHVMIFNQAKTAADIFNWHNTDVWPS